MSTTVPFNSGITAARLEEDWTHLNIFDWVHRADDIKAQVCAEIDKLSNELKANTLPGVLTYHAILNNLDQRKILDEIKESKRDRAEVVSVFKHHFPDAILNMPNEIMQWLIHPNADYNVIARVQEFIKYEKLFQNPTKMVNAYVHALNEARARWKSDVVQKDAEELRVYKAFVPKPRKDKVKRQ